jgi:hypothetical protein
MRVTALRVAVTDRSTDARVARTDPVKAESDALPARVVDRTTELAAR